MNDATIEDLVAQFWLRREDEPGLSAAAFAEAYPSAREPLLAALAASLDIDATLPRPAGDAPPLQIGPYHVGRQLGRGGMGIVWEVERGGQRYALKVLRDPALGGGRAQARFRREIEVLGRLHHPGIVAIADVGTHDGQTYFVMELLPDRSLHDLEPPLEVPRAVALARSIAAAVGAAHAQGIHHRDLKPSNVLLRDDDTPVVVDFGLAAVDDEPTLTGTADVLGTPRYMAPEQAEGSATDARTDVYGIGGLLAQMLSGTPPRQIPRPLRRILRTARAYRPRWRYPDANALAEDLARFQAGNPVAARPPGPLRRGADLARSPRRALGVLALVLAIGATVHLATAAPTDAVLAARHLEAGRPADAAAAYHRALNDDPHAAELHRGLALALESLGDLSASLESLERALELSPTRPAAWRNQHGVLLDRLGEHPRAQEIFRRLVDEHPDDRGFRFNLGYSLDSALQVRAARDVYAEVLRRHPDHHLARVTLAWLHATAKGSFADLHDPERAEELALEAVRGDRGQTEGVVLTAQAIARSTGRTDRLRQLLEQLANATTNDAVRGRLTDIARSLR